MPFKSEKQRRLLWATHPDIAKRWAKEYPESNRNLPMYAHKIKSPELKEKDTEKEAALFSLRNLLKTLENKGNGNSGSPKPSQLKFAKDILTRLDIPHSSKPVSAGEEHVKPVQNSPSILQGTGQDSTQDNPQQIDANNRHEYPDNPTQNANPDIALADTEHAEIAPILKKMGEALEQARNLCRSGSAGGDTGVLGIYARAKQRAGIEGGIKAGSVVRLGTKAVQELEDSGVSIPHTLRSSPQKMTFGIDTKSLLRNIQALKSQQIWAQNPLPLGYTPSSGQSSPNTSPVATYPGMQNSSPPTPGSVNPMLAGSNASTSPISHMGGLKSDGNKPLFGAKAVMGAGNAGFTGAANMHGNEKLPNMTEFASNKLGIPRFA